MKLYLNILREFVRQHMLASADVINVPHIPFLEDEEREYAYAQALRDRCCNGEEVTKRGADARRRIGRVVSVVFQDPATALNPRMHVADQLADPLRVHKIGDEASRAKRVQELISLVGLPSSALDALPGQLSGGQRQRVAIARALSIGPDAIIADEPTSALDVSVRAQILNLLTDLKKELGLAMVFISHDIQTVRYVSDRIAVMNGGKVVEEGPAAELLASPKDPYTRKLLGAAPSLLHPTL